MAAYVVDLADVAVMDDEINGTAMRPRRSWNDKEYPVLDRFLDKKRNLYALAIVAIVFESLSSTVLKLGGQYPFLSAGYLFFFCLAVGIMALYAVAWQLLLERLPLTTAYLRKGLTYVLIFVWAAVFFHEQIQLKQIIGMAVIIVGMVVSMSDEH